MNNSTSSNRFSFSAWLDGLVFLAWGGLFLKYLVFGQLQLLIHPNYFWLTGFASVVLLTLGAIALGKVVRGKFTNAPQEQTASHITLFPPLLSSSLLLVVAIAGFIIPPQIFTSQTAIQRGITETLPVTRLQPQAFRTATEPEERSLLDWVRTLNAYPEPDAYQGDAVKVTGFVVDLPQLNDNYLLICRFVLTCCAIDAYPVGIPVKLEDTQTNYPADTWLEIEGTMTVATIPVNRNSLATKAQAERQLVIAATSIKPIPTPANPYDY